MRDRSTVWVSAVKGAKERIGYGRRGSGFFLTKCLQPPRENGKYVPISAVDYYAALAEAYDKSYWFMELHPQEVMAKEREAARRALELDDSLAEAHVAMATVDANGWDLLNAAKEEEHAIELDAGNVDAHHNYAYRLIDLGRPDEAIAEIRRAHELDPLNIVAALTIYTVALLVRVVADALDSVPEDTVQAAKAMGYRGYQSLVKVELPVGVPVISIRRGGMERLLAEATRPTRIEAESRRADADSRYLYRPRRQRSGIRVAGKSLSGSFSQSRRPQVISEVGASALGSEVRRAAAARRSPVMILFKDFSKEFGAWSS